MEGQSQEPARSEMEIVKEKAEEDEKEEELVEKKDLSQKVLNFNKHSVAESLVDSVPEDNAESDIEEVKDVEEEEEEIEEDLVEETKEEVTVEEVKEGDITTDEETTEEEISIEEEEKNEEMSGDIKEEVVEEEDKEESEEVIKKEANNTSLEEKNVGKSESLENDNSKMMSRRFSSKEMFTDQKRVKQVKSIHDQGQVHLFFNFSNMYSKVQKRRCLGDLRALTQIYKTK